ncbi:hypothetical protein B1790_18870 [Mycobacterium sp. AT1]|nr:hypothetical protein B1790_18870 [Mycobacterium sp. AT1]
MDITATQPVLVAMLTISEAVSRANYFDEVLEVIAEQALVAVGASSLSISRWEDDHGSLRALINVGELTPNEQRWPDDERYFFLDTDPQVTALLKHGHPYANAIDDEDSPAAARRLLRDWGKESELAVPVMCGDTVWGEIWASGTDGRRFDHGDAQVLQAIAAQTAIAIDRSELFSTIWAYAYADPLTGIPNRRAIDERLADVDWDGSSVVALMCDLDGFKKVNDRDGHPAGDELLRRVGSTLVALVEAVGDEAMAARMGGDEFCVLLFGASVEDAQRFAEDATRALRDVLDPVVSVSWGAASASAVLRNGQDLLSAADDALMESKRQGSARFSATVCTQPVPGGFERRQVIEEGREGERLTEIVVNYLKINAQTSTIEALEMLATQVQQAFDCAAWALSIVSIDGLSVYTPRKVDSIYSPGSGLTVLTDLGLWGADLIDYPATARAIADQSTFVAAVGDPDSDDAETALLRELGYRAVLGLGVHSVDRQYLVEFYDHHDPQKLATIAPLVQVLATYCVSRTS